MVGEQCEWRARRGGCRVVCLCEMLPDPDYTLRRAEKRWVEEAGFELREEFGNFFLYQLNFGKI